MACSCASGSTITIVKGDDVLLSITPRRRDGSLLPLTAITAITMAIVGSIDGLVKASLTMAGGSISITPAGTIEVAISKSVSDLLGGTYNYELELTDADGFRTTLRSASYQPPIMMVDNDMVVHA